jgi:hypothetical protein
VPSAFVAREPKIERGMPGLHFGFRFGERLHSRNNGVTSKNLCVAKHFSGESRLETARIV